MVITGQEVINHSSRITSFYCGPSKTTPKVSYLRPERGAGGQECSSQNSLFSSSNTISSLTSTHWNTISSFQEAWKLRKMVDPSGHLKLSLTKSPSVGSQGIDSLRACLSARSYSFLDCYSCSLAISSSYFCFCLRVSSSRRWYAIFCCCISWELR